MKIGAYEFPDDLYYDREHSWARVEGNTVTQGFTDFGQALAGEIIYAEAPRVGRDVKQGEAFMSMESGKWVGRVKAVVSGKISAADEELEFDSTLINKEPYAGGWLAKITMANPDELKGLLRASDPAFAEFIDAERKKYNK
jgi:glycine cleavage system H protein